MITKEKTLSSEVIYKGKILTLRKDTVTTRDGKTSEREIIEHGGAVGISPITADNKIVMVKQYRKAAEKVILEIPAGKIEPGEEDHEDAALRELKEETGYSAGKIEHLTSFYAAIGYSAEVIDLYLATELTPGETNFDESEDIEIYEYNIEDAFEMVKNNEIEDAKTIIAILMLKSLL